MNNCFSQKGYRGKMVLYVLLQLIKYGLVLLPPYYYLLFLNEVITEKRLDRLVLVVVLYGATYAVKTLVSALIKQLYNRIFPELNVELKERVMARYRSMELPETSAYTSGELKERLHGDTEKTVLYWEKQLNTGLQMICVLIMTIILLYLNWQLALISFLLLPVSFLITRYIKQRSNREYERKRKLQGIYNDFMMNNMSFWKEVKSNRLEELQKQEFSTLWEEKGDAFLKAHMCWFMNRTFLAFKDVFLTKMGLYLLGGILVIQGMSTVSVLLVFMDYYADFVERVLAITDVFLQIGEQRQSLRRVEEILNEASVRGGSQYNNKCTGALTGVRRTAKHPDEIELEEDLAKNKGCANCIKKQVQVSMGAFQSMELKMVDFSYDPNQGQVLSDFSLSVQRGEKIAIVGDSGCGKSTLIKLMAGMHVPDDGEILWNDIPMEKLSKESLYERVGFLMQESQLFNLTIRENLQFGRMDASDADMYEACGRANILEFIEGLPERLDTVIGENGIRLSGGQKQRLVIARLFLANPEIIVFDEATSALDYRNESEILSLLLRDSADKTIIMVTHRGTSVAKCDRVINMNDTRGKSTFVRSNP